MAQRVVTDKALARAVARGFSTSARVGNQPQAIKPTTDPQTGKPANPNPPPRAAATTQHPGAKATQQSSPSYSPEPRKPNAPPVPSQYSEVTKKLVFGLARLFGHDTRSSRAIRVTSDLYDRCAEVWDSDAEFWQRECHLPATYQSWFQVTNIHVILLLLRFRAMEPKAAQAYQQELVNHFFIDSEKRMRSRFGIQTGRLVKGYMKEMHNQHRGALLAVDEAIAMLGQDGRGDSRLAMALWRNVFGAGWGDVGGVLSKIKGIDRTPKGEENMVDSGPQLAADQGPSTDVETASSPYAKRLAQERRNAVAQGKVSSELPASDPLAAEHPELAFPIVLSRLTHYFLRELRRMAAISDHEMEMGRLARDGPADGKAPPAHLPPQQSASVGAGEFVERTRVTPLGLDTQGEISRSGEPTSQDAQQEAGPRVGAKSVASFGRP